MKLSDNTQRGIKTLVSNMVIKLEKNNHKGGWNSCNNTFLMNRMREELVELTDAISRRDLEHIINEAADVANFAMMIADNAQKKLDNKIKLDKNQKEV